MDTGIARGNRIRKSNVALVLRAGGRTFCEKYGGGVNVVMEEVNTGYLRFTHIVESDTAITIPSEKIHISPTEKYKGGGVNLVMEEHIIGTDKWERITDGGDDALTITTAQAHQQQTSGMSGVAEEVDTVIMYDNKITKETDESITVPQSWANGTRQSPYQPDMGVAEECHMTGELQGGPYDNTHEQSRRVYGTDANAPSLVVCGGGNQERKIEEELKVRNNNSQGYEIARDGDSIDLMYPSSTTRRGKVQHQQAHTLQAEGTPGVFYKDGKAYRVRRLTEKECFRLMGVKDEDSARIMRHQSMGGSYHMAGDSIVTTCLMALFGQMCDVDWKAKIGEVADEVSKEMRE